MRYEEQRIPVEQYVAAGLEGAAGGLWHDRHAHLLLGKRVHRRRMRREVVRLAGAVRERLGCIHLRKIKHKKYKNEQ